MFKRKRVENENDEANDSKGDYSVYFHYIYKEKVKYGVCRSCEQEKDPEGDMTKKTDFKTELFKFITHVQWIKNI